MGLIEQEIIELRKLRRDFRSGKISNENLVAELAIFSETEKREKQKRNRF